MTITKFIKKKEKEFINSKKQLTLEELLTSKKMVPIALPQLNYCAELLEEEFFIELMNNKDFLSYSILKHFIQDETHIFALELLRESEPCSCCGNTNKYYKAISVSPYCYSLVTAKCDEFERIMDTSYEYIFDILDLLKCSHAQDFTSTPF